MGVARQIQKHQHLILKIGFLRSIKYFEDWTR